MTAYIGIDVSKAKLDIAILVNEKTTYHQCSNDPKGIEQLKGWLANYEVAQVCLESTGRYGQLVAEQMHEAGYAVSVVNPARIKAFGASMQSRNKTDKYDAYLIAQFAQRLKPSLWTPPSEASKQLQERTRTLHSLEETRQSFSNRLKSGITDTVSLDVLKAIIEDLNTRIKMLKEAIDALLKQDPKFKAQRKLLVSIPGIADKTASVLLAELGDIDKFDDPRQLVAYVGINPQMRQSGTSLNKPSHISKQGNARLRTALFLPSMCARRRNPICKSFADQLLQRGKPKKLIVIAVMRKLLHLVFGVLKSGRAFDPLHLPAHLPAAA